MQEILPPLCAVLEFYSTSRLNRVVLENATEAFHLMGIYVALFEFH